MDFFNDIVTKVASMVWGPITIVLLLGTGVYLSFGTRFVQFKKMKEAFLSLFSKENEGEGDITPFQALMTSLAATIGIGNIVGVASTMPLELVWNISDVFNGLMIIPNLIGVLALSPLVFKMTKDHDAKARTDSFKFAPHINKS